MEPQLRPRPTRLYELDLLRFVAAAAVLCYHYTYRGFVADHLVPVSYPEVDWATRYGYLGVELFFIISGYVVLLSAYDKTVKQFVISRVTRLYPAFWAACTLTFLVVRLGAHHYAPTDALYTPYLVVYPRQYLVNMTMLFDYFGYLNLDTAYWSLTYELTFYFLITLVVAYQLTHRLLLLLAGWLGLTALLYLLVGIDSHVPAAMLFIPKYSPYFAAGMLFYLWQRQLAPARWLVALLVVAWGLALVSARHEMQNLNQLFHDPRAYSFGVVAVATTSFFGLFGLLAKRVLVLPRASWLPLLGALTYPLYLLHSNIGYVAFQRLAPLLNRWALLGLLTAAMLGLAYLVHVLVERRLSKPLGNFAGWLLNQRLLPRPPAELPPQPKKDGVAAGLG